MVIYLAKQIKTNKMKTILTEDYIKYLFEQRLYFYNEGKFEVVNKINSQIFELCKKL